MFFETPLLIENMQDIYQALLHNGQEKEYKENDIIASKNTFIDKSAFVIEGQLKINMDEDKNTLLLYHLTPKDHLMLSFMNFISKAPLQVKATALTPCRLLWVDNSDIMALGNQDDSVKNFILNTYQTINQNLLGKLKDLLQYTLEDRLLIYLKEKAKLMNNNIIPISRQEIALDLSVSRITLSRALNKLESQLKILRNTKNIVLIDMD